MAENEQISMPTMIVVLQIGVILLLVSAALIVWRKHSRSQPVRPETEPGPESGPDREPDENEQLRRAIAESIEVEKERQMIENALKNEENENEVVVEEVAPISFPDLTSAGNCHDECNGGCTESSSATSCFACKHLTQTLRNKGGSGFKCVQKCDDTYYLDGDKCKMCSSHCHTCTKAEVCETCPGSMLLIDVDNLPHYDHGKCVESCPPGLIADYETNLVQARCIWRKDLCGEGYYINSIGKCDICDSSCKTCSGPGPMSCDVCSNGYGKGSIGYCRPCCTQGSNTKDYHCEDCSKPQALRNYDESTGFFASFLWVIFVVFLSTGCVLAVCQCFKSNQKHSSIDYTPLPHYNAVNDKVNLGCDDEDSEDDTPRI
ncbi:unnamed protein product [Caenorhabditis angaria]|uniref:Uncharacterized protein n=1 Tax=Caenorhabditis angaria TaxID=860376 RepID=A0A9P1I763_9PELO|nr:unnamed protein product [Caenorhabditis angaria]